MVPNMAMHGVKNVTAGKPWEVPKSEEPGDTFWTASIMFTGEDGKVFNLPIFGKTKESVTVNVG